MYKKISAILLPVVVVVLVVAIIWGIQKNEEKAAIQIKAENQYQRAFHDLSFHIDHLHTEIGNALAVNSTSQGFHRRCLINAWRLTSQAQSEIDQLPLNIIEFDKTEEFLSKIARFSYQTAVRDLAKEPLSPDEMKTLMTLYKRSDEISKEINSIQEEVLKQKLRWSDVEIAEGNENSPTENPIVNGFQTMNKSVSEYSEVNWGPSISNVYEARNYEKIEGRKYSSNEIKEKAVQFLKLPISTEMKIEENGVDTDFESYSVSLVKDQANIKMDFSKKGGNLIWLMNERNVGAKKLNYNQAKEKALEFLKGHDYDVTKIVNYNEYRNTANMTFASMKDDVIIYPDKITVKVALDNGEVTGVQAADYIFKHKERTINPPLLTLTEAKKKMNPEFEVNDHSLALIENDLQKEVLCHQFIGRINGSQYRLFINSKTGLEEKIEQLEQTS